MYRYWVSWWQGGDDARPITYPPPLPILGWWISGERFDDEETEQSICAVVEAESEDQAWEAIKQDGAWPDAGEERFCEQQSSVWIPTNRFEISGDWMKERFGL